MNKKEVVKVVGENIRRLRKDRGLSQEELSENSNITPGYLSDIENNKRSVSLDTLVAIANALSVFPSELLRLNCCKDEVCLQELLNAIDSCRKSTNHLFDCAEKVAKLVFKK
ncbi:MAG: helix-turn-helix transcriptional regulator [Treponema sp.]|nr:helix-turn-helix transcriptional regulator [Treponema sp.]MBR1720868.1 helix-turn-helix transcriptional regulator [Treponema sp.]